MPVTAKVNDDVIEGMLRSGEFAVTEKGEVFTRRPARYSKPGARVPWRITGNRSGNDRILLCFKGRVVQRSRFVYRWFYGPIPAGHVVHHRDRNSVNDDPLNLEAQTESAHGGHGRRGQTNGPRWYAAMAESWSNPERRAQATETMRLNAERLKAEGYFQSEEFRQKAAENARKQVGRKWSEETRQRTLTPEYMALLRENAKKGAAARWKRAL